MGRTILADESIEGYIEKLISSGTWHIGLVVGHLSAQKDYAVRLVRSSDPVKDEDGEEEEEEEEEDGAVVIKKVETTYRPPSIAEAEDDWIATHAKQACRMLPGGMDVIGIFALADPDVMKKAATKLRQMVFAVHKVLSKYQLVSVGGQPTDRYLLQICSVTRKLTCRTFDVADYKSVAKPAEWRYNSQASQWLCLDSQVPLDLKVAVPAASKLRGASGFLKHILRGITPYCQTVWEAQALINNSVATPSDPLEVAEVKKGKGKDKHWEQKSPLNVSLFGHLKARTPDEEGSVCTPVKTVMWIRGTFRARGYAHSRATNAEGIEAVKLDIIRSLVSRCELLAEDIDVIDEDEGKELYDTPMRVLTLKSGGAVEFCDYIFQDEKVTEVTERFLELLDLPIQPDSLDLSVESPAAEADWLPGGVWSGSPSVSSQSACPTPSSTPLSGKLGPSSSPSLATMFLVSAAVLLVAAVIATFFLES